MKKAFLLTGSIDIPSQPTSDAIIGINDGNVIYIEDWMFIFPKLDLKKGGRFLPGKSIITTELSEYELTYNIWEETDVYKVLWQNDKIKECDNIKDCDKSKFRIQYLSKSDCLKLIKDQIKSSDPRLISYVKWLEDKTKEIEDQYLLIYSAEDKKELIDILEYLGTPSAGTSYTIVGKSELSKRISKYIDDVETLCNKKTQELKKIIKGKCIIESKCKQFLNEKNDKQN